MEETKNANANANANANVNANANANGAAITSNEDPQLGLKLAILKRSLQRPSLNALFGMTCIHMATRNLVSPPRENAVEDTAKVKEGACERRVEHLTKLAEESLRKARGAAADWCRENQEIAEAEASRSKEMMEIDRALDVVSRDLIRQRAVLQEAIDSKLTELNALQGQYAVIAEKLNMQGQAVGKHMCMMNAISMEMNEARMALLRKYRQQRKKAWALLRTTDKWLKRAAKCLRQNEDVIEEERYVDNIKKLGNVALAVEDFEITMGKLDADSSSEDANQTCGLVSLTNDNL